MLLIGSAGCSDLAEDWPLANARTSPEALARAALQAMAAEDAEALDALRITRDEYETLLWPVLPDREFMPFEFVWSVTEPRSRKGRREVMAEYKGVPLELVRVELGEEIEAYEEFTLYKEARMIVRRTDTGEEGPLPLMDALVVMGRGWKFMNFKEDL